MILCSASSTIVLRSAHSKISVLFFESPGEILAFELEFKSFFAIFRAALLKFLL